MLLHRFGLIPLFFSEEEIESFNDSDYIFSLNVSNNNQSILNVTTHDFKIYKNDIELTEKEIHRIFPINDISKDPILITRLRENEVLELTGNAIISTARKHAGFSPVSLCTLHFKQDQNLASQKENILDKERAFSRNEYGDPTVIIFEIETEMALSAKYLVSKSFDILIAKLVKLVSEINIEPSEYISYELCEYDENKGCMFTFENEDDTLGNLLQSTMYNYYIREKNNAINDNIVTYVGYICPHPLNTEMKLHICFDKKEGTVIDYINTLTEHCKRLQTTIETISSEWNNFMK